MFNPSTFGFNPPQTLTSLTLGMGLLVGLTVSAEAKPLVIHRTTIIPTYSYPAPVLVNPTPVLINPTATQTHTNFKVYTPNVPTAIPNTRNVIRGANIDNSTLVNPTIIDSQIDDSVIINPQIVLPHRRRRRYRSRGTSIYLGGDGLQIQIGY